MAIIAKAAVRLNRLVFFMVDILILKLKIWAVLQRESYSIQIPVNVNLQMNVLFLLQCGK
jgi:hypothetical protein